MTVTELTNLWLAGKSLPDVPYAQEHAPGRARTIVRILLEGRSPHYSKQVTEVEHALHVLGLFTSDEDLHAAYKRVNAHKWVLLTEEEEEEANPWKEIA